MIIPREVVERTDFPGDYDDFVVVRDVDPSEPDPPPREETEVGEMIRDVVYEVDEEDAPRPSRRAAERPSAPRRPSSAPAESDRTASRSPANGTQAVESADVQNASAEEQEAGDEDLPTLEEAEKQLISRALKKFDGNRRKTAQALGISERTLYRKLKDIDEDL
jgi:DNA-binding NtrC family response regulator